FEEDAWDYDAWANPGGKPPLTTEKHQERFDRALNRVVEIIQRKAN
ncbi:unnamed protein product, partial [marine sediment metagenome]